MRKSAFVTIAALAALAGSASAQTNSRRATIRGGGSPDQGKCTIEVVVDGAAEVEVRGDTANLRNLSGQPPQWRRFECTSPMPANPPDFRFAGVDGRGRQELVRDPRNGGAAVVRIEDRDNGAEGYTFDLLWSGSGYGRGGPERGAPERGGPDRGAPERGGPDRGGPERGAPERGGPEQAYGGDRRGDDSYYRNRETWFRGQNWRGQLFQKVREDLDYVQSVTFPSGGDQFRLARTRQEMDDLQGKLAAGRYDQRELDDVIQAVQRVVRDNRLSPRDRDVLADDVNRLRDFRARHDEYGAREGAAGGDQDVYHQDRDERFRGQNWRAQFFQHVREDLEHVQSASFPSGGDQYRLVRTRQELDDLQSKLAAGRYDERELDDVIGALQRVVQDNRLSARDRDVLADDLTRMRDFRTRPDSYGAR